MKLRKCARKDGMVWRCGQKYCKRNESIRENSYFFNSRLSLETPFLFMYEWCRDSTIKDMVFDLGLTKKTIIDWCRFLREVTVCYSLNVKRKIGGKGKIVEIDESVSARRKYNKGRRIKTQWMVGSKCRMTGEFFIEKVDDRSSKTLVDIIQRRIEKGSLIISDCWKGYYNIKQEAGFEHLTINHSKSLVNKEHPFIHAQNIDNLWHWVKVFLKKKGTNRNTHIVEYLAKYNSK